MKAARLARPDIVIVSRARDAAHASHLYEIGVTDAVPETVEASLQLSEASLELGFASGGAGHRVDPRDEGHIPDRVAERGEQIRKADHAGDPKEDTTRQVSFSRKMRPASRGCSTNRPDRLTHTFNFGHHPVRVHCRLTKLGLLVKLHISTHQVTFLAHGRHGQRRRDLWRFICSECAKSKSVARQP